MKLPKKLLSVLLSALLLIGLVNACSPRNEEGFVTQISGTAILNSDLAPADKAEELAKAAEELLTYEGFAQAHELSLKALEQDSKNLRAGFVKNLTGTMVAQKGMYIRVKPLADKHPKTKAALKLTVENSAVYQLPSIHKFLLDGVPDITNEKQLQAQIDIIIKSFNELRLFAKENKLTTLTVKANPILVPDQVQRYVRACEIKTTAALEYELVCLAPEKRFNVTFNRADFEVLKDMASAMIIYGAYSNSYDLTGMADLTKKDYELNGPDSSPMAAEALRNPEFGKLRPSSRLQMIKWLGIDMVSGLNWIMANQTTLCRTSQFSPQNRVGLWLNQGICLPSSSIGSFVDTYSKFVNGESISNTSDVKAGKSYTTKINIAFFNNPPSDLRNLRPFFDRCGNVESLGDKTIGGLYPNGDGNEILKLSKPVCSK